MFHLQIVTPEKKIYDGDASYLAVNTDEGEQVILPGHAAYMSKIALGELRYKTQADEMHPYAVSSGFLQIQGNDVYVLADNALHTKDIDLKAAEEAKRRAEELIKTAKADEDIDKLKSQIRIANLHLSIGKKYRTTHTPLTEEIDRS